MSHPGAKFSSISSLRDPGTVVKGEDLWLSAPVKSGADGEARRTSVSGTEVSQNKQGGLFNLTLKRRRFPGLLTLRAVE